MAGVGRVLLAHGGPMISPDLNRQVEKRDNHCYGADEFADVSEVTKRQIEHRRRNGPTAQLPASGDVPQTTTSALSLRLPDTIGSGGGRAAAAPC